MHLSLDELLDEGMIAPEDLPEFSSVEEWARELRAQSEHAGSWFLEDLPRLLADRFSRVCTCLFTLSCVLFSLTSLLLPFYFVLALLFLVPSRLCCPSLSCCPFLSCCPSLSCWRFFLVVPFRLCCPSPFSSPFSSASPTVSCATAPLPA